MILNNNTRQLTIMEQPDVFQTKQPPQLKIPKSSTKGQLKWTWGSTRNVYRSFENAKTYVRALELDSIHSFREFAKMYVRGGPMANFRLMPTDIPVIPEQIYAQPYGDDTPFDWDDFLGTKKSGRRGKKVRLTADGKWYFPYEEFKKRIQAAKVRSHNQYLLWRLSVDDKVHLPKDPEQVYGSQWEGWAVVLLNDIYNRSDRIKYLMPIDQAIKYVHTLQLRSQAQYNEWWRAVKPLGLPVMPDQTYAKDWVGWPKFLGTRLEDRLEVAKLNVDALVITKLKTGNDLYRVYIDQAGHAHALANTIDDDQIVTIFKYNNATHAQLISALNQYCRASQFGNTVVHCYNIQGFIQALDIFLEEIKWKEIRAVKYGAVTTVTDQQNFANKLLIPGRDPIFDQRAYHFDPFDHPDADFIVY